jgi:AcrR family transcriptional regulator
MPRPNLSSTRRPQILDAFSTCIARYGLEGTSLERIAAEAGMKRTILRHYVGNRDNLVIETAQRILDRFMIWVDRHLNAATDAGELLQILFTVSHANLTELTLFARFSSDARVELVRPFISKGVAYLTNVLERRLYRLSTTNRSSVRSLAVGISSLCLSQQILNPAELDPLEQRTAAELWLQHFGIEIGEGVAATFDDEATEIGVND